MHAPQRSWIPFPLALALGGCSISGWVDGYRFDYEGVQAERSVSEPMPDGVRTVALDHLFGDVHVVRAADGEAPSWEWRVACWADDEVQATTFAEDVTLTVERTDARMKWTLDLPQPPARGLRGVESTLWLRVADPVAVELENRHGDAFVRSVGDVHARCSHGDLELDELDGTIDVDHIHGNVSARGFAHGRVDLSHGHVVVTDARGPVEVRGSHGNAELTAVAGDVDAERNHGDVRVTRASGPVRARGSHVDWWIDGAAGLDVSSSHTDVVARAVSGSVQLRGSHFDATFEGPAEVVDVTTQHGDVHLTLLSTALSRLSCEVQHGDVDVTVPAALDAFVRARVSHGDVDSDLPVHPRDAGPGEVRLYLWASHGDVRVRRGF